MLLLCSHKCFGMDEDAALTVYRWQDLSLSFNTWEGRKNDLNAKCGQSQMSTGKMNSLSSC